ncbi:MAG: SIMPL domain-containing protein [Betaproteobacteria bacterium]|nr:SIMPL domain-containing protein [Betaproteobacteria bacterium]
MRLRGALLAILLLAPLAAAAQVAREPLFNLVSLSAQAESEVPNDTLVALLAVEAEGADPAQLADDVNRSMHKALALARGVAGVKLRSGAYQTSPVYDKARIVRWRVRQELRLESSDFAAASALIGKLQSILTVASVSLSVSPQARHRAENALIEEALAAFRQRAQLVREALKAKGYRIRDLQVSSGAPAPRVYGALRGMAASVPAFEPGTSQISVSVSGTIQLE